MLEIMGDPFIVIILGKVDDYILENGLQYFG